MPMRRDVQHARSGGWISTEADLSRSVAELDLEKPGWDAKSRLRGVVRRLEKDPSAQGIQAAIDVYGQASVYQAMPCAGLELVGEVVMAADGRRVYPAQGAASTDAPATHVKAVERLTAPDLSERETQVLLAIAAGRGLKDIAESMGMSLSVIRTVQRGAMSKLNRAARQEAGALAPLLKQAVK